MPTAPTPITPYATPPSSSDTANFDARADAKVADDAAKVTEYNALAANVYANAVEAHADAAAADGSATNAAASALSSSTNAAAAAASAGAALWVSGTTYAVGATVWSPTNFLVYRRRPGMAGAGTTDPSLDATHWALVGANGLAQNPVAGTSAACPVGMDTCFTNSAACAGTAPPAPAVNDEFGMRCDNGRRDNTLDLGSNVLIGPNGQTLTGVITLNIPGPLHLRWWSDNKWRTA